MQYETYGITIWFYSRTDVPSSLTQDAKSIDTSTFGTPAASWSSSSCDIEGLFGSQQMVLDITVSSFLGGCANIRPDGWSHGGQSR